ncbi:hypothetical protein KI387_015245 [Taxus chinensis]|uniref:Uncharacterized protein n=1 Tax=Taxus chinensis TaxID=29808 RepID=A0AA38GCS0_TAXCH|nr:hypothetical protein KI387_015245 [Taxus chinensis]
MSLMLNEYEEPPQLLLSILVEGLEQKESCLAHSLARRVVNQCASKVKTCIQGISTFVIDDEFLASNNCMGFNGCKKKSNLVDRHEEDISVKHMHDQEEIMAKEHVMDKLDLKGVVQPHHEPFEGQGEGMVNDLTIEGYTHSYNISFVSTSMWQKEEILKHSLYGNNILMFDKLLVPTNCIKLNMSAKGAGFQEDYEDGLVKRHTYEERTSWNVYDMEDPEIVKELKGLGWHEADQKKVSRNSESQNIPRAQSIKTQQSSVATPFKISKSKTELQKELLGLKRMALALRHEGRQEEADAELSEGKLLKNQ